MNEKILSGKYSAKHFFIFLGAICTIAFILKVFLLPAIATPGGSAGPFQEAWANAFSYLFDVVIQTTLTTLVVSFAFLIFVPKELRIGQVVTLHAGEIGLSLNEFLSKTEAYWFRGRSGRWFRSQVLPELIKAARSQRRTINLNVLLPNPDNSDLMVSYANYRNSIPSGSNLRWTANAIKIEILGTIVATHYAASKTNMLSAHIGVLDMFSLVRLDITSGSAVLTREDPTAPAQKLAAGSALYLLYREEVTQGIRQGRSLQGPKPEHQGVILDATFVEEVLDHTGLRHLAADSAEINEILDKAENPENPYG